MVRVVQEYHGSLSHEGHVASLHALPHVYIFNLNVFIHNLTQKFPQECTLPANCIPVPKQLTPHPIWTLFCKLKILCTQNRNALVMAHEALHSYL